MATVEPRTSRLSFFGRTADELTRRVVYYKDIWISVNGTRTTPLYKQNGFFAITDIALSNTDYEITIESFYYQTKAVNKSLPGPAHEELAYDGEDELYVIIDSKDTAESTVGFAKIPFLPLISKGSKVIGPGGFTTELADDLGGEDVTLAKLANLGSLNTDQLLRFVRGNNLLLKPDPYYPFTSDMTILALKVVADTASDPPIETAEITITAVNSKPVGNTVVGTLTIKTVELDPGPLPALNIMGTENDIKAFTNSRGDAVFYYHSGSPVTSLTLSIAKAGFVTDVRNINLSAGKRTFEELRLTPS